MPTPFYHLKAGVDLLQETRLPGAIRRSLLDQRCSFLFGQTAPDVQVVSGQTREATHFFRLPIPPEAPPAWIAFLQAHPAGARPGRLNPAQAAFTAGYLCHLHADWFWIKEIYAPIFGPFARWKDMPYRSRIHNILRAYLDEWARTSLDFSTGFCLEQVNPSAWLPFVQDGSLREWRDFISRQLTSGSTRTVEVFAGRLSVDPESFYEVLESEERMDAQVFAHISRERVSEFYDRLIDAQAHLMADFFEEKLC